MNSFMPYANEHAVIRMGDMEIGNRIDRITLAGDLVLTRDAAGLALAKELQALINRVVDLLEADKQLPEKVNIKPAHEIKNPF